MGGVGDTGGVGGVNAPCRLPIPLPLASVSQRGGEGGVSSGHRVGRGRRTCQAQHLSHAARVLCSGRGRGGAGRGWNIKYGERRQLEGENGQPTSSPMCYVFPIQSTCVYIYIYASHAPTWLSVSLECRTTHGRFTYWPCCRVASTAAAAIAVRASSCSAAARAAASSGARAVCVCVYVWVCVCVCVCMGVYACVCVYAYV